MSTDNTAPTVSEIVSNPKDYGFDWYTDKVQKGDLGPWYVPLVRHLDVDLLRLTFGDRLFLDSADSTSRHVTNQRIGRDMKADKPLTTELAIKTAIVENMLGMKTKRRTVIEITKYVWGGKEFSTREEAMEQAKADLTAKGYPAELIEDVVSSI